ncbi:MAG: hypothetical protein Q8J85_07240 [Sulfuricurvum sp.]|nr:hypothetical protein [Sulfuricurvum sp.]MDP3022979.1 hypothetical protein [Sulfuricurvum sp.]
MKLNEMEEYFVSIVSKEGIHISIVREELIKHKEQILVADLLNSIAELKEDYKTINKFKRLIREVSKEHEINK